MATETIHENKKYRDLLKTSRELFFKHGTKRVTIEEICEKSGVSKMTFYKFFRNKEDLLMKMMHEWVGEGINEYNRIMEEPSGFMEKIERIIRFKIEKTGEYGDEFFNEILFTNERLKDYYLKIRDDFRDTLIAFFRQGQDEGIIRRNMKPEFYLFLIDHFTEMLNDEKLRTILPDIHDRYRELVNFFFYGFNECEKQMEAQKQ